MVERIVLNEENLPKVKEMLAAVDDNLSDNISSWTVEGIVITRRAGTELVSMWQLVMYNLPQKLQDHMAMNVLMEHPMNINGYCNELYRRFKRLRP